MPFTVSIDIPEKNRVEVLHKPKAWMTSDKFDGKIQITCQNFVMTFTHGCYDIQLYYKQGFPTFFAARTPLSGQSILSTPEKNLRYILLYKRYISCSVTQGSSYPLMFNLVPLGGTSTPGWEPLSYSIDGADAVILKEHKHRHVARVKSTRVACTITISLMFCQAV